MISAIGLSGLSGQVDHGNNVRVIGLLYPSLPSDFLWLTDVT